MLQEEEAYKKVRMHLKRHKVADLNDVSKATGVELESIHQLLQDGRVSLMAGSTATYPCKACEGAIQTGALCLDCVTKVNDLHKSLHAVSESKLNTPETANKPKKGAFHTRS